MQQNVIALQSNRKKFVRTLYYKANLTYTSYLDRVDFMDLPVFQHLVILTYRIRTLCVLQVPSADRALPHLPQ